jgi:hypothetical protein
LVAFLLFKIEPIFRVGQPVFEIVRPQKHKSRHEKLSGILNKFSWKNYEKCETMKNS